MLLAEAVVAGITFDAFIGIDLGPIADGIYVYRFHRTNISAVAAGNAFFRVDPHRENSLNATVK
jgi:hypothetical protein